MLLASCVPRSTLAPAEVTPLYKCDAHAPLRNAALRSLDACCLESASLFSFAGSSSTKQRYANAAQPKDSAVYEQGQFKWAMAGRNREKVEATRSELMKSTPDAGQVEVVIANTEDKASLDRMVSSTDVLISMVGPYDLHGKPVLAVRSSRYACALAAGRA